MKSVNPATSETRQTFSAHTEDVVASKIAYAHNHFNAWRRIPLDEKTGYFEKLANILKDKKSDLAKLMTSEMGKRLEEAVAEIEKCAWLCEYYAENASDFLMDEKVKGKSAKSYIAYQPLGIILGIMPWNFPFWQVFRFAVPNLILGNVGLLKHASNVPECAVTLEALFVEAGFPEHTFTTLLIGSEEVESIIQDERIRGVTLTGSEKAGKKVAQAAGAALKKTVLELGGSDPYLILKDADVEHAVECCLKSRLLNNGQSCIAAKRFIVDASIHEVFVEKLHEKMQNIKMGDPLLEETDLGPMANEPLRDDLHAQVTASVGKGAQCLLGGKVPNQTGSFYPATLLTGVEPGMPAFDEELFGPVASVIQASNEQEAIALANQTIYGLGAAVFTKDEKKGEQIAKYELQAGSCFVNDFVKSDPRLPFGGIKQSGYGRELAKIGLYEFANIKTVVVA